MSPQIITYLTFGAASLGVLGLGSLLFDSALRTRGRVNDRLRQEFGGRKDGSGESPRLFKDLWISALGGGFPKPGLWRRFQNTVERSGVRVRPEQVLLWAAASGLLGAALALSVASHWSVGIGGAAMGFAVPLLYVQRRYATRIHRLRAQLPEAFDLMSRGVRAGQTIAGAMQVVAADLKPPLAEEFAYCCEQQSLGLSPEVALRELAHRTGVIELQMFVVALLVQRQTGGNPVEVLNNLSAVIRKRLRLAGKVRALTAEGRLQAVVLSVLPAIMFVVLLFVNHSYAQVLLDRPRLLIGTVFSELLGALWIRKIVNFNY
ncbi:MAG: type II secretion system F family protein [Planctomycetes bacterium]|nr:type II secretion system F family protein [Planctomycetota bacterium]